MKNNTTAVMNELLKVHITGNIIPPVWYKTIIFKNGKAHHTAITILADILYWYKPTIVRDPNTGETTEIKKKFNSDKLQKTYQAYADFFGFSKKQVIEAIKFLKDYNIIVTEIRTIKTESGMTLPNMLFIEPVPNTIKLLTMGSIPPGGYTPTGVDTTPLDVYTITNTTTNTTNIISKEIKGSLDLPQYEKNKKYRDILSRTVISIGGFKTQIHKNTKTMESVYKYMEELENGTFLRNKTLGSPLLKDMDITRIKKPMTIKGLEMVFKKAARNWRIAMESSDIISPDRSPSLDSWLYTAPPHNKEGLSWFLYAATGNLQEKGAVKSNKQLEAVIKYLDKINPGVEKLTERLYNKSDLEYWGDKEYLTFYYAMKALISWRLENKDRLREYSEAWNTWFGSHEKMFTTIGKFLEDNFGSRPYPKFLEVDSPNWNKFCNWCQEEIQVIIK